MENSYFLKIVLIDCTGNFNISFSDNNDKGNLI